MDATLYGRVAKEDTPLGLGVRSSRQQAAALAVSLAFLLLTIFAARFGTTVYEVHAFLPVVATLWAGAEMLTAFLLASQFFVTGRTILTRLAGAYAITGMLTLPYLAFFPGIFMSGPGTLGDQQVSVTLWICWHLTFPLLVAFAFLADPEMRHRVVARGKVQLWGIVSACASIAFAVAVSYAVVALRSHLPVFVDRGHFEIAFTAFGAPAVVIANAIACVIVFSRARDATPLQLWLGVALFTSFLDGALNSIAPARYSIAWYVGKFETFMTAGIVLSMLLFEISKMYRHIADMASLDPLTGLQNRRELDERISFAFERARNETIPIAMLLVDVDYFKKYNDRYGHAAGDAALRRVAGVLAEEKIGEFDVVARYGGEEFVLLQTGGAPEDAAAVAGRIKSRLTQLAIPHDGSATLFLTASVGIAYATNAASTRAERLFDFADRALYAAKERGRNDYVLLFDGDDVPPSLIP